jgi:hypothetical protein
MFNVLGEPFLNKKLFDYIALCEEYGVEAALITNITLLTEERLKRLFQFSNVDLNLSLHTPTDKSFAERGSRKSPPFANISSWCATRWKRNSEPAARSASKSICPAS